MTSSRICKLEKALFSIFLTGSVLVLSCTSIEGGEQVGAAPTSNDKTQTVAVVHPAYESYTAEVLISGKAYPNRMVAVHAMENGAVEKLFKDIGDRVKKGEILATLVNPELLRDKQGLEARLSAREAAFRRLSDSYRATPGIIPIQKVEEAESKFLSAQADLNAVLDRLSFLGITAPFSGVVTKRYVDEGALVQSGLSQTSTKPLFEIQQTNPVRVRIPLPESDAAWVVKGMKVTVNFPELAAAPFEAEVSRISGAIDPKSGTMDVEIDVENAEGVVKPGMYAKVTMEFESVENVLSLPITAQLIKDDVPHLVVVNEGVVSLIPLRKGLENKDFFQVLNSEIDQNSEVVVRGKSLVVHGEKVNTSLIE